MSHSVYIGLCHTAAATTTVVVVAVAYWACAQMRITTMRLNERT